MDYDKLYEFYEKLLVKYHDLWPDKEPPFLPDISLNSNVGVAGVGSSVPPTDNGDGSGDNGGDTTPPVDKSNWYIYHDTTGSTQTKLYKTRVKSNGAVEPGTEYSSDLFVTNTGVIEVLPWEQAIADNSVKGASKLAATVTDKNGAFHSYLYVEYKANMLRGWINPTAGDGYFENVVTGQPM